MEQTSLFVRLLIVNYSETSHFMTHPSKSPILRKVLPILVFVGLLFAAFRALPLADWLQSALDWVDALGPWGPVASPDTELSCTDLRLRGPNLSRTHLLLPAPCPMRHDER